MLCREALQILKLCGHPEIYAVTFVGHVEQEAIAAMASLRRCRLVALERLLEQIGVERAPRALAPRGAHEASQAMILDINHAVERGRSSGSSTLSFVHIRRGDHRGPSGSITQRSLVQIQPCNRPVFYVSDGPGRVGSQ